MTCLNIYKAVAIFYVITVVGQHADAGDRLSITTVNGIDKMCTAGGRIDLTRNLRYRWKVNGIDHIHIPDDMCINVHGKSHNHVSQTSWPGIAAYIRGATSLHWKCIALRFVTGSNCCGITTTSRDWKRQRTFKYRLHRHRKKRNYYNLLHHRARYWYWASWLNGLRREQTCCQICKCAGFCQTCDSAGGGKCNRCLGDYPACRNAAGDQVCTAKCKIEIGSSGTNVMPASNRTGYIKVKHMHTGSVNVYWPSQGDGTYLYKLELSSCTVHDDWYFSTVEAFATRKFINWNQDAANANIMTIQYNYASSNAAAGAPVPADPYIKIAILTGSSADPLVPIGGEGRATKYKNIITGCPGAAFDSSTNTSPNYSTYVVPYTEDVLTKL